MTVGVVSFGGSVDIAKFPTIMTNLALLYNLNNITQMTMLQCLLLFM